MTGAASPHRILTTRWSPFSALACVSLCWASLLPSLLTALQQAEALHKFILLLSHNNLTENHFSCIQGSLYSLPRKFTAWFSTYCFLTAGWPYLQSAHQISSSPNCSKPVCVISTMIWRGSGVYKLVDFILWRSAGGCLKGKEPLNSPFVVW